MRFRRVIATAAALLIGVSAMAAASQGPARHKALKQLVYHPTWHQLGSQYDIVAAGGHFAVAFVDGSSTGVLLDERTGTRTNLHPPGADLCGAAGLAAGRLLIECDNGVWFYSLAKRTWTAFQGNIGDAKVARLGSHWLQIEDTSTCVGGVGCSSRWGQTYVNLTSGRTMHDPTDRRTYADLNAPGLYRKLCSPLTVPTEVIANRQTGSHVHAPGWVEVFRHGWVIATGSSENTGAFDRYIERCGAHEKKHFRSLDPVGNSKVVLWVPERSAKPCCGLDMTSVRGFLLSNGRPVQIMLPPGVPQAVFLFGNPVLLSNNRIYIGSWWANLPAAAR